jgi:hypothetical protein
MEEREMSLWVSPVLWHLRWPTVSGGYRNWLERQISLAKVPEKDREGRRKKRQEFSDRWNYVLCFIAIVAWLCTACPAWILWIVGLWRAYEIVVNQANVLFATDREMTVEKAEMPVKDPRRLLLVALFNYIETAFWFAALYRILAGSFLGKISLASRSTALYYSLVTMVTLGYGDITPTDRTGIGLVIAHITVGTFLMLMVLARFVSALPMAQGRINGSGT